MLEGITAAQEALELLLPAGDFAGALDILCDLTAAGTPKHVAGLQAFKALPKQLADCEEVRHPWTCESAFFKVKHSRFKGISFSAARAVLRPVSCMLYQLSCELMMACHSRTNP